MNAKRTIGIILFAGFGLLAAAAGCATSSTSSGDISCSGLFAGTACESGCSTAQSMCSAAGQSGAFNSFLSCASNEGFQCSSGSVAINGTNCMNLQTSISACASGMSSTGDSGASPTGSTSSTGSPTGTMTGSPTGTTTGTTGSKDSGTVVNEDSSTSGDAGDPCDNCANSATNTGGKCDSDATACNNDAKCTALLTCLNACGTNSTACMACETTAGTAAVNELEAVNTCICDTACPSQCGSECSSGDSGTTTGGQDSGGTTGGSCDTCASAAQATGGQCYSEVTKCMNSTSCTTLVNCINNCTTMTCANNCESSASSSAVTDLTNLNNCICGTACTSECASEC